MTEKKFCMDHTVAIYLNQLAASSPTLSGVAVFFAQYFPYLVAFLFVYVVWRHSATLRDTARFFLEAVAAVFLSRAVFVELIRFFLHRPRPYFDNHAIVQLLSETSYSFPSGNAAFFFALATTVYLHDKRWGVSLYIASVIIGIARVMAGVHYPTDILGGAALGIAVGWGVHWFFLKKSQHPTRPPL